MDIIRSLTEKSWLTVDSVSLEDSDREDEIVASAPPTGLRVYFAVATVLFLIVGAAYLMRMGMGQATPVDWRPTPKPWLLWLNSAFLIFSSLVFQRARVAAHRGQMDRVSSSLLAAGLLAFAFLLGQVTVWRQFAGAGYYLASNPANAFFYLITTLHGLHLLGGLVAWGRTTVKVLNGAAEATEISRSVDLCAIYWHFLLIVWLAFFYLLLTT